MTQRLACHDLPLTLTTLPLALNALLTLSGRQDRIVDARALARQANTCDT